MIRWHHGDLVDHNLVFLRTCTVGVRRVFTVEPIAGKIVITLNKSHVAHGELFDMLQQDTSNMTPQQLQQQI